MQDFEEVARRIGIARPEQLFESCPPGVSAGEIARALRKANMSINAGQSPSTDHQRLQILCEAGKTLIEKAGLLESAVYLSRFADAALADTAPLVHIRLIALYRSGKIDEVTREAERVLQSAKEGTQTSKIVRNSLRQWHLERRIAPKTSHLLGYFDDPETALQMPFKSVSPSGPYPLVERIVPVVAELRNEASSREKLSERIKWGVQAHRQMVYLRRVVSGLADKKDTSDSEKFFLSLHASHQSRIDFIDPADILSDIAEGRSVVLADLHAGMMTVQSYGMPFGSVPMSVVSMYPGRVSRPQDFHMGVSGNSVQRDLAKLVKLMRKDPRVVRIFPDGGFGEKSTLDVLGRRVEIGKGGASISWTGRAVVYSGRSVWNGERFAMELHRGPSSADYTSFEDFEAAFNSFYAARIDAVLRGAPEDMAPTAGFWRFFC
jgi:hypothetical protein